MRIHFGRKSAGDGHPRTWLGRLGQTFFFALFAGMGLLFVGVGLFSVGQAWQARSWPAIPCQIIASAATQTDDQYKFEVRYRYTFEGRDHESTKHEKSPTADSDYAAMQRLVLRYPAGSDATCYVNPRDPAEAVLKRPGFGFVFMIPFASIFVAIGVFGIRSTWRQEQAAPVKRMPGKFANFVFPCLFFTIFLIVGLLVTYFWSFKMVRLVQEAQHWEETPCVVISSRVQSHDGDEGTTYSVDILYEYRVNGRAYRSNRFNFIGGSSSGYEGKAEVVKKHPPGHRTVCYVNPADPTAATLDRRMRPGMLLGLLPLVFVFIGAGGLVWTIRQRNANKTDAVGVPLASGHARGPVELRAKNRPLSRLILIVLAALFWNGIVSVFVAEVVRSWQRGRPEYFLTVFMIPFVAIGLFLIGAIFYALLGLFNPRPRLTLSSERIPLGGSVLLEWEFSGNVQAIRELSIALEGSTQRTEEDSKEKVFVVLPVAQTTHWAEIQRGRATLMMPADTQHSFLGPEHKVCWTLKLKAPIRFCPAVKEEYNVIVTPAAR